MYSSIRSVSSIFWKFFAGFWLTIAIVTGLAWTLSADWQEVPQNYGSIEHGPRAQDAVNSAMGIARWGGKDALIHWLMDPQTNRRPEVFVLDRNGVEISGRTVPEAARQELEALTQAALAQMREQAAAPAATAEHGAHAMHGRGRRMRTLPQIEGVSMTRLPEIGWVRLIAVRTDAPSTPFFVALWHTPWWVYLLISVIVLSVVAWMLASRYSKPIRRLNWAMQQAAQGDFEVRIASDVGNDSNEIGELARQYDRMAERIHGLLTRQKRLFHDVSHELRSPLARMNVAIELAQRDRSQTDACLMRMQREVANLDALVGELLTYARLDENAPMDMECVEWVGLLESVVEDADFEGSQRQVHVSLDAPECVYVRAHVDSLMRAVENLIRNALRFSPAESCVRVALATQNDQAVLTITDSGPGMPDEDIDNLFEPFVRGKDQATGNGFGLGLAIAKRAVSRHAGTLTAQNVSPHGLQMRICLPLARQSSCA